MIRARPLLVCSASIAFAALVAANLVPDEIRHGRTIVTLSGDILGLSLISATLAVALGLGFMRRPETKQLSILSVVVGSGILIGVGIYEFFRQLSALS